MRIRGGRFFVGRGVAAFALVVLSSVIGHASHALAAPEGLTRWPGSVVLVHDQTGDPQVAEAAGLWDALGVIRVLPTSAPCRPGQACIEVTRAWLPDHIGGVTPMTTSRGIVLTATVRLNYAYEPWAEPGDIPAGWELGIIAHEMGHALGLVHAPQSTCALMTPVDCGVFGPTAYDAWMLQEAYQPRA